MPSVEGGHADSDPTARLVRTDATFSSAVMEPSPRLLLTPYSMTFPNHPPGDPAVARENADISPRPHILVADDEPGIRRLVSRTLERAGYEVTCVADGSEALARIDGQPFDLLITDLVMPETEGIETIMRLHRTHPGLPIIAMSGGNPRGPGDFLSMAQLLGARVTLRKPFDCDALLGAVERILAGRA